MSSQEEFNRRMLSAAESSDLIPDIGIDGSLVKYSGLNSAAELENSITHMLKDKIPDYVQSLGSALAAFKKVPNAVGLGAVALSIALELIIRVQEEEKESKDSTLDMMRRVFAEEKASGVRDSMEEYLKRLRIYLHQPTRALEETERLEKQLSEQLTRLKNSMLHDNQMSSRSLKHWTNGAAFHLHMLIHAVRLKRPTEDEHQLQVHVNSIKTLLDCYQFDIEELLKQYKIYKKSTISVCRPEVYVPMFNFWVAEDKELERKTPLVRYPSVKCSRSDYVDYMFDNWTQLKELKSYFSDLKEKIKDLITQNSEFNMQNVLPVSEKQGE